MSEELFRHEINRLKTARRPPNNSAINILCCLALTMIVCGGGGQQAPASDAPGETLPTATEPASSESAPSASAEISDACSLLAPEDVQQALGLAAGMAVEEKELPDIHQYNEDAYGCSWQWEEGVGEPASDSRAGRDQFDTWASRMVVARLEKDFSSIDGPGDVAVFHSEDSHLCWHRGERWLFSLSFAGASRQA